MCPALSCIVFAQSIEAARCLVENENVVAHQFFPYIRGLTVVIIMVKL